MPENWCWVILGNFVKICRGASPRPIKSFITDDEAGINWIKIGDADSGKYIVHTKEKVSEAGAKKSVFVDKGTLLLSNSMSFGRPYILNIEGCIHDGWLAIIPSEIFTKEYLYYALMASEWYFQQVAVGTAVRNLNSERVAKTPMPLPPKEGQYRIVNYIENMFAKLDEAKEKAQAVVDGFETRKAAILQKAFAGELTLEWRKQHYAKAKAWEKKRLSQCCKIGSGRTPSRKYPGYYNGAIPWVKTGEIDWNEVYNSEEHITEQAIVKSSAKLYAPGTILVAMYGMGMTRGRAAILMTQAATNQAVCALQPDEYLNNRFLYYFFMCNYWTLREKAIGGNQLNLSATIISKFEISLPDISEQIEIVCILERLIIKEQRAKEIAEAVLEQIETIKKSILARAFRGELETNEASEESAMELLKSIL